MVQIPPPQPFKRKELLISAKFFFLSFCNLLSALIITDGAIN